jgi:Tfp pilus assembly protein PilZ
VRGRLPGARTSANWEVLLVEKRGAARSAIHVSLEFVRKDSQEKLSGVGTDISVGGMFVETATPAAFGSSIVVRARFPGHKDELVLPAVVRWKSPIGMGVQFGLLGVRETHVITEIVKAGSSAAS